MRKFNGLLLTIALSFFTLFLCKLEGDVALKKHSPTHKLQDKHALNASAVTTTISSEELLNFDEHKYPSFTKHFYADTSLNKIFFDIKSSFLKVCDVFDFSLSIGSIIFPFHSFL
tara:strand:- start:28884 stop:29228 length:345 start_codon:yes stop_codon:yes gene_type:complete